MKNSLELFAGCGCLAYGLHLAGFQHSTFIEKNRQACEALRKNIAQFSMPSSSPIVIEDDATTIDYETYRGLDLVSGGPPCQPFSSAGKALGSADSRDMWPTAIRAIRETRPKAFIFENVKGLMRPKFKPYVQWILAALQTPSHLLKPPSSSSVLLVSEEPICEFEQEYEVLLFQANSADFGAAQIRHRVFFIGIRLDILAGRSLIPPRPTHSSQALIKGRKDGQDFLSDTRTLCQRETLPWRTCQDAFVGLPLPFSKGNMSVPSHHYQQDGAKKYPGHTGSPLNYPAKALKAGTHGIPGGENMLDLGDGKVRYFTLREAARLQGLPDDWIFTGSWSESMRQLGNGVPVEMAKALGDWITPYITTYTTTGSL